MHPLHYLPASPFFPFALFHLCELKIIDLSMKGKYTEEIREGPDKQKRLEHCGNAASHVAEPIEADQTAQFGKRDSAINGRTTSESSKL
jgi:hypothetical protein